MIELLIAGVVSVGVIVVVRAIHWACYRPSPASNLLAVVVSITQMADKIIPICDCANLRRCRS
jgi:hypothetical protein